MCFIYQANIYRRCPECNTIDDESGKQYRSITLCSQQVNGLCAQGLAPLAGTWAQTVPTNQPCQSCILAEHQRAISGLQYNQALVYGSTVNQNPEVQGGYMNLPFSSQAQEASLNMGLASRMVSAPQPNSATQVTNDPQATQAQSQAFNSVGSQGATAGVPFLPEFPSNSELEELSKADAIPDDMSKRADADSEKSQSGTEHESAIDEWLTDMEK
jgi:hypothetical protein